MKIILILVMAGLTLFCVMKIGLYAYRPFFLNKLLREIQTKYDDLIMLYEKELKEATDNLNKYESGDDILIKLGSEDEFRARIKDALQILKELQESNVVFIRLKERFLTNNKMLSESIIAYQRYLELRLNSRKNAHLCTQALASGGIALAEFVAAAKEDKILIEESEKKLYRLLDS